MSATNAISGISLVGSLVAAGSDHDTMSTVLGTIAVASATINVVGGFIITDRMLKMFKRAEKPDAAAPAPADQGADAAMSAIDYFIQAVYLAASVLFIFGLKSLTHPDSARRGMQQAAMGMLLAIVGTLLHHDIVRYDWIIGGLVVGTVIGIPLGVMVPMTAMPQRIAISHMFGALAATLVGIVEYSHGTPPAGPPWPPSASRCSSAR